MKSINLNTTFKLDIKENLKNLYLLSMGSYLTQEESYISFINFNDLIQIKMNFKIDLRNFLIIKELKLISEALLSLGYSINKVSVYVERVAHLIDNKLETIFEKKIQINKLVKEEHKDSDFPHLNRINKVHSIRELYNEINSITDSDYKDPKIERSLSGKLRPTMISLIIHSFDTKGPSVIECISYIVRLQNICKMRLQPSLDHHNKAIIITNPNEPISSNRTQFFPKYFEECDIESYYELHSR